jgi:hypothetical protein
MRRGGKKALAIPMEEPLIRARPYDAARIGKNIPNIDAGNALRTA